MIERKDLYHIPFYEKSSFSGSFNGMHYRLEKVKGDEETTLKVSVWPGPYCYEATSEDKKTATSLKYSEEGIAQACDWLNERYAEKEDMYKLCHI